MCGRIAPRLHCRVRLTDVLHLLILAALVVALPLWDRVETRRLRTSTDPRARVQSYRMTIAWQLAMTAMLVATVPLGELFTPPAERLLPRMQSLLLALWLGVALTAGLVAPVLLARRGPPEREKMTRPLRAIAFFLPRTREERAWFAAVSVTVGICEEIIFRGFLIRYLDALPIGIGIPVAVVIAALVFGINHGYQGPVGMLTTGVLALVFTALFFLTGSLLVPIVFHGLLDLRILALLPRDDPSFFETPPPS